MRGEYEFEKAEQAYLNSENLEPYFAAFSFCVSNTYVKRNNLQKVLHYLENKNFILLFSCHNLRCDLIIIIIKNLMLPFRMHQVLFTEYTSGTLQIQKILFYFKKKPSDKQHSLKRTVKNIRSASRLRRRT